MKETRVKQEKTKKKGQGQKLINMWVPDDLLAWMTSLIDDDVFDSYEMIVRYSLYKLKRDLEAGKIRLKKRE